MGKNDSDTRIGTQQDLGLVKTLKAKNKTCYFLSHWVNSQIANKVKRLEFEEIDEKINRMQELKAKKYKL